MSLIYIFIFIFGTIIGSFLNVVIDRFNTGRGLGGRSRCDATGKVLAWHELIPVFSFLIQGGKSRYSKTKLSLQYPLVEAGTGLMFAFLFYKLWPRVYIFPTNFMFFFLFFCYLICLLIIIFVYDLKHKIIP
ncbi:MAG: prepilin peptidase, partial [Candidatus Paceibacterota bacterium]